MNWMKNNWKNAVSVYFLDVDWPRKRARSIAPSDTTMPTSWMWTGHKKQTGVKSHKLASS